MNKALGFCMVAALATLPGMTTAAVVDEVVFTPIASGVSSVVAVRHAGDGSGRLFLVLRNGSIRIVDAAGTLLTTPFLNIGSGGTAPARGFTTGGERGLLGLAFHPQYSVNRRFFVYYTDGNGDTVVAEYLRSLADPNLADTTARPILRVYQPYSNHNGGDIHFGPDGYLYIGLGDGGSGDDPCNSGQSLTTASMIGCTTDGSFLGGTPVGNANAPALLGKMLRIDVNSTNLPTGADLCGMDPAAVGTPALRTYGIPTNNPFAGDAGSDPAACDETYHYGLRNPWRFSFDRLTHDLIIGDVGQNRWEELDLVPGNAAGLNFGWKICEGFHVRGSTTNLCTLAGRTDPILAYRNPTEGYSIAGGWRYRGPYTSLHGIIFSGDYIGKIFAITQTGGTWSIAKTYTQANTGVALNSIVGFGEGEDGHLYVANLDGAVFRIDGPLDRVFADGFEGP